MEVNWNVGAITALIPPELNFGAADWVLQCTMFPYASFVLERNEEAQLFEDLSGLGNPTKWARVLSGIFKPRKQYLLRVCPECRISDLKNYGETYFHRLHQIPGVDVCGQHLVRLREVSVSREDICRARFVCAGDRLASVALPRRRTVPVERRLAGDVATLLNKPRCVGREWLSDYFKNRLINTANGGRPVSYVSIELEMNRRFGPSVMARMFSGYPGGLPHALTSNLSNGGRSREPWIYLLLGYLLDEDPRPFFDCLVGDYEAVQSDRGPWPCLNPQCSNANQQTITSACLKREPNRSTLAFTCSSCGGQYSRPYPLTRRADGSFIYLTSRRRSGWAAGLPKLWANRSLTIAQIALILGVSAKRVGIKASLLGLPTRDGRLRTGDLFRGLPMAHGALDSAKQDFLQLRFSYPTHTRTQLWREKSKLCATLSKHARDWFEVNAPTRRAQPRFERPREVAKGRCHKFRPVCV
jgi:hypothetical protein